MLETGWGQMEVKFGGGVSLSWAFCHEVFSEDRGPLVCLPPHGDTSVFLLSLLYDMLYLCDLPASLAGVNGLRSCDSELRNSHAPRGQAGGTEASRRAGDLRKVNVHCSHCQLLTSGRQGPCPST